MTMFRYFPGNDGWSYHFAARIVNVAQLGGADFHEAHRVLEQVKVGDGERWYHAWQAAGTRLCRPEALLWFRRRWGKRRRRTLHHKAVQQAGSCFLIQAEHRARNLSLRALIRGTIRHRPTLY